MLKPRRPIDCDRASDKTVISLAGVGYHVAQARPTPKLPARECPYTCTPTKCSRSSCPCLFPYSSPCLCPYLCCSHTTVRRTNPCPYPCSSLYPCLLAPPCPFPFPWLCLSLWVPPSPFPWTCLYLYLWAPPFPCLCLFPWRPCLCPYLCLSLWVPLFLFLFPSLFPFLWIYLFPYPFHDRVHVREACRCLLHRFLSPRTHRSVADILCLMCPKAPWKV
mmetsp:Transcript_76370/g.119301  ORF Transcript_76370/g.119301 Transcript_76370/m.119301 type:complete len:219 (-) Transcript_76370:411-1067(-)